MLGLIAAGAERALGRLALASLDGDLAGRVDHRLAPDHGDLVLLHQEADAVVEPFRHRARALDHGGRIEADLLDREPVVLGVLQVVEDLGRAQQRLGRDAAPVEADAAQIFALDDRGLEAELRRADRGDVAAGPGADDDDVEGVCHLLPHCTTSLSSSTIGFTLAICSRSIARISAWVEPDGSAPTSVMRLCTSGCFAAAAIS